MFTMNLKDFSKYLVMWDPIYFSGTDNRAFVEVSRCHCASTNWFWKNSCIYFTIVYNFMEEKEGMVLQYGDTIAVSWNI